VVDAAMVDGTSVLAQMMWSMRGAGAWTDDREANLLDGAAPFYDTYTCADGRWIAVGALEGRFYEALLAGLGLAGEDLPAQLDVSGWPVLRARFTEVIAGRTRDEWVAVFEGTDACVTPVLSFEEAPAHPHVAARDTIISLDGVPQAAPAPRFSRTPQGKPASPRVPGADTDAVLADWEA
jgi:alpha-methylacyl-CoA racemase